MTVRGRLSPKDISKIRRDSSLRSDRYTIGGQVKKKPVTKVTLPKFKTLEDKKVC